MEKICEKIVCFGDFMWEATKIIAMIGIASVALIGAPVAAVLMITTVLNASGPVLTKMFLVVFIFVIMIPWAHLVCSLYLDIVKGRN